MKNTFKQIRIQIALALILLPLLVSSAFCSIDRILAPAKELTFLIGPFGGGYFHSGISSLYIPNETNCLPQFTSDSKLGLVYGIKAFIPVTDYISVSPRVQFENISSDFSRNEKTLPILGQNNNLDEITGVHKLDLKLNTLDIDLLVTYSHVSTGIYGALGPSVSFLSSTDYTLTSNIEKPGVTFLDGTTSKTLSTGKMTNLNTLLISVRAGIGWNYQLTDLIYINPEVLYSFPLNKIAKDSDSKIGGFLFTLGVLFSL